MKTIIKNRKHHQSGAALVITLMVLAVLSMIAVTFSVTMRLEEKMAVNNLHHMEAKFFARSAMEYAAAALYSDLKNDLTTYYATPSNGIADDLNEDWAVMFADNATRGGPTTNDVDLDGDGTADSRWIEMWSTHGTQGGIVGRYAVLVRDTGGMINVNTAGDSTLGNFAQGFSPAAVAMDDHSALSSAQAQNIMGYRYGSDSSPGSNGVDDDGDNEILENDGIDNDGDWDPSTDDVGTGYPSDSNNANEWGWQDGKPSVVHVAGTVYREPNVDEANEGVDEPDEQFLWYPEGDDIDFAFLDNVEEISGISSTDLDNMRYDYTVFSYDRNIAFASDGDGLDGTDSTYRDNYWRPKANLNYPLWREYTALTEPTQSTVARVSFRGRVNDSGDSPGGPTLLGMMEKWNTDNPASKIGGSDAATNQIALNIEDYIDKDIFPTRKTLGGTTMAGVEGLRITEIFANSDQAFAASSVVSGGSWVSGTLGGRNCMTRAAAAGGTTWSNYVSFNLKRAGNYYIWIMCYDDAANRQFRVDINRTLSGAYPSDYSIWGVGVHNAGWRVECPGVMVWLPKGPNQIRVSKDWGAAPAYDTAAIQWIRFSQNGQSDYIELTNFSNQTIDLVKDYDYLQVHSTDQTETTGSPASYFSLAGLALQNLSAAIRKIYPGERIVICQDMDATTKSRFNETPADDWDDYMNFEDAWGDQDRNLDGSVTASDFLNTRTWFGSFRMGKATDGAWWFMDLSGGTETRWGADRIPGTSDDPAPPANNTGETFRVYEWDLCQRSGAGSNPGVAQNMGENPGVTSGGSITANGWNQGCYACVRTRGIVNIEEYSDTWRKLDRVNLYDYGIMCDMYSASATFTLPWSGLTNNTPTATGGISNEAWELVNPMLPDSTPFSSNWAITNYASSGVTGTPGKRNFFELALSNSAKGYYINDGPVGNIKELAQVYRASGANKLSNADILKLAQYVTIGNEIIIQAEQAESVTLGGWTLLADASAAVYGKTYTNVPSYLGASWWYDTLEQVSPSGTPIYVCANGAAAGTWIFKNGVNGVRLEDGFYYLIFYGKYKDWWIGPDGVDSDPSYPNMGGGDDASAKDSYNNDVTLTWDTTAFNLDLQPDNRGVYSGSVGSAVDLTPVKVQDGTLTISAQEDTPAGYAYFDYIVLIPAGINIPDIPSWRSQDSIPRAGRMYGKINVNTATSAVLQCLPGITSGDASSIISNRPYSDLNDLATSSGLTFSKFCDILPLVTVNSDVFEVFAVGEVIRDVDKDGVYNPSNGDRIIGRARLRAVVDRGTFPFTIKYLEWVE
ncbi:helix-hairpin-helix domain-containing protein [bacterium]|jgi:Tfp pilus assembly protein PilX|nr:helix-hairpin-helix domain-containing protein [bacterium]